MSLKKGLLKNYQLSIKMKFNICIWIHISEIEARLINLINLKTAHLERIFKESGVQTPNLDRSKVVAKDMEAAIQGISFRALKIWAPSPSWPT